MKITSNFMSLVKIFLYCTKYSPKYSSKLPWFLSKMIWIETLLSLARVNGSKLVDLVHFLHQISVQDEELSKSYVRKSFSWLFICVNFDAVMIFCERIQQVSSWECLFTFSSCHIFTVNSSVVMSTVFVTKSQNEDIYV